jgi:hypothetical protein
LRMEVFLPLPAPGIQPQIALMPPQHVAAQMGYHCGSGRTLRGMEEDALSTRKLLEKHTNIAPCIC